VDGLRPRLAAVLVDLEPVQHLAGDLARRHLRAPARLGCLLRAATRLRDVERALAEGGR
jgi:hypothetical protein